MSEYDIVAEWLEIANADLDVAQYLFARPVHKQLEIICYHCQQSVEKSLKAFLCANDVEIPKVHAVSVICHQCSDINPAFSDFIKTCEILEVYATQTRYPSRIELDEPIAKQALTQALAIYNFVSELLKPPSKS